MRRARTFRAAALSGLLALLGVGISSSAVLAQNRPTLRVVEGERRAHLVPLFTDHGYAAVDAAVLEDAGWSIRRDGGAAVLRGPEGALVTVHEESPFLRWNGAVIQMVGAPYREGGSLRIPLQLLSDVLPRMLPERYAFEGASLTLRTTGAPLSVPEPERREVRAEVTPPESAAASTRPPPVRGETPELRAPSPYSGTRVVVIDAGHGGRDPGSISRNGIREKVVALGVARALATRLEREEDLEVHLVRDDDTFVEVWNRGPIATEQKGDRPGVFISVHANSFNSSARGFETYFLSEARTEHERRVAAIENAPVHVEDGEVPQGEDLGFILRELRNLDHQHWSVLLAEMVQEEIDRVHPGPNRGVKQGPLAVLTNVLMPAVLVEVGYLSHPDEARLLGRSEFQREVGDAIGDAVVRFFERYPPGSNGGAGGP